jgi:hypothetical protein
MHPSRTGQGRLADLTWSKTFDFLDASPPVSFVSTRPNKESMTVALNATDDVAVRGSEYKLVPLAAHPGVRAPPSWRRYVGQFDIQERSLFTYRSVDVNGNTERARTIVVGR